MGLETDRALAGRDDLSFVWLELTGKCQLECVHCYADSGPGGDHGHMTVVDWQRVIDQAAELGTGMVQFIGGEPTLHPALPDLVKYALGRNLRVEVFSNLVHVPVRVWEVLALPGVSVATSFYSADSAQHAAITRRRGSRDRTQANIVEAVRRSIPVRVGLIELDDEQRVAEAENELRAIGVADFGRDRLRQVGRGIREAPADRSQLCGACGHGKVAVAASGEVWPCVFSRWMTVGNVRDHDLAEIVRGPAMRQAEQELALVEVGRCNPRCCPSTMCDPQCSPSCSPSCKPAGNCTPSGNCAPNY